MKRYVSLAAFAFLLGICVFLGSLFSSGAVAGSAADDARSAHGNNQISALMLGKRAYPEPNVEGKPLYFDLTVRNNGPDDLTQVSITDTLPSGARWGGVGSFPLCRVSGNAFICSGLTVPANGTTSVFFSVISLPGVSAVVNDNYAAGAPLMAPVNGPPVAVPVVTPTPWGAYPGPTGTPAPPTARPTQEAGVAPTPLGQPHLVISQSIPSELPAPGQEVVLRVVVTNDGTAGARDVVLSLQVPAGLGVEAVTIVPDAASEWQGNILWVAWGYIEAGATSTVEVRAVVLPGAPAGGEVVIGVPDYGLEARAPVGSPPQLLPPTGLQSAPWWGWAALAGGLVLGGFLLLKYARRRGPAQPGE